MVKDTLLLVYNRFAERDIHEAADDPCFSLQVNINEEKISYLTDARVSEKEEICILLHPLKVHGNVVVMRIRMRNILFMSS